MLEWRRQRKEISDLEDGVVEITHSKQQKVDWKKKVNIASETFVTIIKDLTFMSLEPKKGGERV